MKNLLIIYPHWYPVNLAGVHRPRLIGNFLPEYGWHPIILTVKEEFFEEMPDDDFKKTFRNHYEEYRVNAFKPLKIRIIGDIGIRSFFQLYFKAKKILASKKIDFIWIPVPSYYPALIGRLLHHKFRIPYGIDYIDPWVRDISNYPSAGLRQHAALILARFLEPIAVKRASLISGVARAYFDSVLDRNDKRNQKISVSMPYGFDPEDHKIKLAIEAPWSHDKNIRPFIYAGAFLPNSVPFFKLFFNSVKTLKEQNLWDHKIKLYFIGTGHYRGPSIEDIASNYNLRETVVEIRNRFPYLHILNFLSHSEGVMALGSPSPHYTASKIFQAILSQKPVFAFFHEQSTVVDILKEVSCDQYLMTYIEDEREASLQERLKSILKSYFSRDKRWSPNIKNLEKYSASQSAWVLTEAIEKCIEK